MIRRLAVIALVALLSNPSAAAGAEIDGHRVLTEAEALAEDAAQYAVEYDVSQTEAERRLSLQQPLGDLAAAIAAKEPASFAGSWIEHDPYQLVVSFTGDSIPRGAQEALKVAPSEVRVITGARHSLAALEAAQGRASEQVTRLGVATSLDIDQVRNAVLVGTITPLSEAKRAEVRTAVQVTTEFFTDGEFVREDVYGGHRLTTQGTTLTECTTGFSVRNVGTGTTGVLTAGHCNDPLHYWHNGTIHYDITLAGQRYDNDQDWQWHFTPVPDQPQFWSGSNYRTVTGTEPRLSMVGDYACHYGWSTGYSCGTIQSIHYTPTDGCNGFGCSAVWVRVAGATSSGGDSGGPWFSGGRAYGVHTGSIPSGAYAGHRIFNSIGSIQGPGNNLEVLIGS